MSIDSNTLIEGAKLFPAPIKSFNNLWDITIGNKLEAWNQKSILKNNLDVKIFKESIENKMSQNSPDKFQEPTLSIIGPALEASKFYIEEEDIRNMFANLIAASMNSDFNNIIHHSFVEIIKQMSPLDAKILNSMITGAPLVDIIHVVNRSYLVHQKNFYFSNIVSESLSNSISIDNLIRLGLIVRQEDELTDKSLYNHFYNSETLRNLKIRNPKLNFQLKKTHLLLTNLGNAFKAVCCNSDK